VNGAAVAAKDTVVFSDEDTSESANERSALSEAMLFTVAVATVYGRSCKECRQPVPKTAGGISARFLKV
jgi:hypothetical protein